MAEDAELRLLLDLDGASFESPAGYVVEFSVRQVPVSRGRPHGVVYSLVLRPRDGGTPWVRFDNAHSVPHRGGKHVRGPAAFDHWHRTADDPGEPYRFTTTAQLLDDFWHAVRKALQGRGVPYEF